MLAKRRAYLMDDEELVGLDYIWRVSLTKFHSADLSLGNSGVMGFALYLE